MSEEDGYKVADLEVLYGEMDGYSAEARAANCCSASASRLNSITAR
jgi:hypothetical protein